MIAAAQPSVPERGGAPRPDLQPQYAVVAVRQFGLRPCNRP